MNQKKEGDTEKRSGGGREGGVNWQHSSEGVTRGGGCDQRCFIIMKQSCKRKREEAGV